MVRAATATVLSGDHRVNDADRKAFERLVAVDPGWTAMRRAGDVTGLRLDVGRVRGGMTVGFLAALQGVTQPENVVLIVATLAGLCVGIALRKSFRVPARRR